MGRVGPFRGLCSPGRPRAGPVPGVGDRRAVVEHDAREGVLLTEYGVRSTVWAIERNMAFCELGWSGRASNSATLPCKPRQPLSPTPIPVVLKDDTPTEWILLRVSGLGFWFGALL